MFSMLFWCLWRISMVYHWRLVEAYLVLFSRFRVGLWRRAWRWNVRLVIRDLGMVVWELSKVNQALVFW